MIKWKAGRTSATQWFSKWHLCELFSWIMRNQRDGDCISRAEDVTGGLRLPVWCQIQLLAIAVCHFSSTPKHSWPKMGSQQWVCTWSLWRCSGFPKYFDIKSESKIINRVVATQSHAWQKRQDFRCPFPSFLIAHSCSWDEQHQHPAQNVTTPTQLYLGTRGRKFYRCACHEWGQETQRKHLHRMVVECTRQTGNFHT